MPYDPSGSNRRRNRRRRRRRYNAEKNIRHLITDFPLWHVNKFMNGVMGCGK
jgi:hypothetical protein